LKINLLTIAGTHVTKRSNRNRKSQNDRQHNSQNKKDKKTNNDVQGNIDRNKD